MPAATLAAALFALSGNSKVLLIGSIYLTLLVIVVCLANQQPRDFEALFSKLVRWIRPAHRAPTIQGGKKTMSQFCPALPLLLPAVFVVTLAVVADTANLEMMSFGYLVVLFASIWRFKERRLKRTEFTYEFCIALGKFH